MLTVTDRIVGLMTALSSADIEALPPAERRRLADQCRRVIAMSEPRPRPRSGVLVDLGSGARPD